MRHRPAVPPRALAVVLVLIAVLLCACGGAQHARPTAGKSSRTGAGKPLTRARALVFAHAVNLTSADVPGFVASRPRASETAVEKRLEQQLRRCAGGGGAPNAALAHEQSQSFQLKRSILDLGVSSEVGVSKTAALAAGELAAIRSQRVRGCFTRYLDTLLKSQRNAGAAPGPVSIAAGTPPAPGAAGSFGWRITATFTVRRIKVPLYVDILGFVLGPARVTLVSSGALRPFPAVIQQRLYSLLLARARARSL
jgi:hypothetical protein